MAAPSIPSSHLESADALVLAGRNPEAIEEYQKAYEAGEIDASNAQAWEYWGVALYRTHDYKQSIEKLDNACRANPQWAEPYMNRGAAFAGLNQYEPAIENYRKAAEIDPNSAQTHFNWGNSLFRQQRYAEAAEQYSKAITIEPGNSVAWGSEIKTLRLLQRFEEAESVGREALKAITAGSDILEELAGVYFDQADYTRGIETIDKALQLERQDAQRSRELWKVKLAGLSDAPEPDLVKQAIAGIEKEFPGEAEMLVEAGRLWKSQLEFEKAITLFDRALGLRTTADTLLQKGWTFVDWGRLEQAIEQFDRVLELDKNNVAACQWKVFSLRQRRRLDEAEALLDKLLAAGSPFAKEAVLFNERGTLRLQQTRFDEAIDAFRGTLRIDSSNADALANILFSHRLRRDFEAADLFWNEEIVRRGVSQGDSLFVERCQFFADQKRHEAGLEYCRQRPANDQGALEREIMFLRDLKRFGEAEKKTEAALASSPRNVTFLFQRASIHFDCRRYKEAALSYHLVLEISPNRESTLVGNANALYAQGPEQFNAAERAILEALDRLPENAPLHTLLAQIYYDRGQPDEAEKCLSKAIALSPPDYLGADFLRLEVLEQLKRGDEARLATEALVRERRNDLDVRSQAGWFYLGRNDTIGARREFEFIHELDPKHLLGVNGLAGVYYNEGDFKAAADLFREASEIDPYEPVLFTNIAWAMVRLAESEAPVSRPAAKWIEWKRLVFRRRSQEGEKEQFSEPEKRCRDALKLNPEAVEAYTCLGAIAFKRGRILESEDCLRTSIRLNARKGGYRDLGALYVHMGKYDEAETNLKKAVETSRADSGARIELGNLYLQTGRENEGIRLCREAVDIDPANPDAPRALALALKGQGDFREAEQVLRKAIQKLDKPRRWQLHLTLAQLLTELGEKSEDTTLFEDALTEITIAITLKPLNPDAHFRAGIIRHRLEDYPRAVRRFRECLRLDPDHIDAARNLRIVQSLIRDQLRRGRSAFWLGLTLGVFCLAGTVAMWYLFLFQDSKKITSGMIEGLTPTLIAVAAAAFLFPYLVHLKLPGVEAELSQPVEKISKGPVGGIGK